MIFPFLTKIRFSKNMMVTSLFEGGLQLLSLWICAKMWLILIIMKQGLADILNKTICRLHDCCYQSTLQPTPMYCVLIQLKAHGYNVSLSLPTQRIKIYPSGIKLSQNQIKIPNQLYNMKINTVHQVYLKINYKSIEIYKGLREYFRNWICSETYETHHCS